MRAVNDGDCLTSRRGRVPLAGISKRMRRKRSRGVHGEPHFSNIGRAQARPGRRVVLRMSGERRNGASGGS